MGIESWREYCDCIECYQVYTVLSKDIKDVTKEEYEYIKEIQLPDDKEYTKEVKDKLGELEMMFGTKANNRIVVKTDDNKSAGREDDKSVEYKKYDYGFNKKKNNKMSYRGK